VAPVGTHHLLHLTLSPPEGDLSALVTVDAKALTEQTALYRHTVVPAPRHSDLVNEVDHDQAHQDADSGKVYVTQN
jgi:hypothetical protein